MSDIPKGLMAALEAHAREMAGAELAEEQRISEMMEKRVTVLEAELSKANAAVAKATEAAAALLEDGAATKMALAIAERACAAAEAASAKAASMATTPNGDSDMKAELTKSRTSETAALLRVATAEATVAQMRDELAAARGKPAVTPKAASRIIRNTVRERDPNGHARVVDTEIMQ